MATPDKINFNDDMIDSRNILARLRYLDGELETAREERIENFEAENSREVTDDEREKFENETPPEWEHAEEHKSLSEIIEEIGETAAHYGVTLVNDSHFEDYAEDYARDVCGMSGSEKWPFNHIDWEKAANELQSDYTQIEIDGQTFWYQE